MFKSLQTKLTVLYAGLFGAALVLVAVVVYVAISRNAQDAVRNELISTGTVFDHLWELRSNQMRDAADLLARDYGFRAAAATQDEETIRSALSNLRMRIGFDIALFINLDGDIVTTDATLDDASADELRRTLRGDRGVNGIFTIGSRSYEAISASVLAPTRIGWVLFVVELDRDEMRSLERLSAIPLTAAVLHRNRNGVWASNTDTVPAEDRETISQFVKWALASRRIDMGELTLSSGAVAVLVKPLATVGGTQDAALLLQYPLALAFAPYQPLLFILIATGLIGLIAVLIGSWALARNLTRPISALDAAAQRLQRGDDAQVDIKTHDELARLGRSFNTMADEIRAREQKITHLALHDAETGLANRRALEAKMAGLLPAIKPRVLAVSAIGIERFPFVRGAIGYGLATELVREVGERLSQIIDNGHVARLSTAVLGFVFDVENRDDAERILGHLLDPLEQPVRVIGNTIDVSLTIGTAVEGLHGDDAETLLERATIALDQARAGKRKQAFFDPVAYGDPASNLSLISDMLRALENGEMSVHYQPKVDIRSAQVVGAEALLRWRHATRGMIRPDLFVGMAEETGHIRAVTDWVLQRVIADQAALREDGHDFPVSINVSGRLMSDRDFASMARRLITEAGAQICVEITETAVIENPEVAFEIVAGFKSDGITISIDDYGSGLSSLSYLKQINADELKLDKSLVLPLAEGKRDALLVKSTIDLAHGIGMKVTAEGVETGAVYSLLASMGCDIAQGYLIARPMPFADFHNFVSHGPDGINILAEIQPAGDSEPAYRRGV
jgi:predicted signal transduction protein with EAL and GGDEF domain